MTSSNRKKVLEIVMIGDIGICFVSLALACMIASHRQISSVFNTIEINHPGWEFLSILLLACAWQMSFTAVGLYRSHRITRFFDELYDIGRASLAGTACVLVWCLTSHPYISHAPARHLEIVILFGSLTFAGLSLTRMIGRRMTHLLRIYGRNLRSVLIIGTNHRALSFAHEIADHPEWGYQLLGFADNAWHDAGASEAYQAKLLGGLEQVPDFLRTLALDEVIVALPMASYYQQAAQIVALCKQQGILVRFAGGLFDLQTPGRVSSMPSGNSVITLLDESWDAWSAFIKRSIDVVGSSLLLVACSPILAAVAIAMKLSTDGPILFAQERLGMGKRRFKMYKFRTMVPNAEALIGQLEALNETQGPTFKLTNDPRVTKLGRILRKTSLDELPQLFNVLLGDMSLVGPRPLPLRDYNGFSQDWHRRRFSVKPGITCLWQITGRSTIGFEQWMELDMNYIDQWSIWLDIKILFHTIPAIVRGSGAV